MSCTRIPKKVGIDFLAVIALLFTSAGMLGKVLGLEIIGSFIFDIRWNLGQGHIDSGEEQPVHALNTHSLDRNPFGRNGGCC